jgi:hypothetical protein
MVLFIRWRVVAEESGAANFGFGGAMLLDLLDLLGPMVRSPAVPSPISILVLHRALPDLQRMKLCYSESIASA